MIETRVDRSREPWRLSVRVDAGEPVRISRVQLAVTGAGRDDPVLEQRMGRFPLGVGAVLRHGRYEAFKTALLTDAVERGYLDASLARHRVAVDAVAREAEVDIELATGERYAFGPVLWDETLLGRGTLAKLGAPEEGTPYTQEQLRRLRARLRETGYFDHVAVRPGVNRDAGERVIPLVVDLTEAPGHTLETGVGYSTDTRERVSLSWRTPRINRAGHSQETRLRYSPVNPAIHSVYELPLSDPLDDVMQLRVRLENNDYGDIQSDQREAMVRREQRRGRWVQSLQLRALRESWNLGGERTADYLLPGIVLSRRDRRGSEVDPEAGFSQYYELEVGAGEFGAGDPLLRSYMNLVWVGSLSERWRWVARGEAGAVFGDVADLPPSLSFFTGGDRTLRGFGYRAVGRTVVVENDAGEQALTVGGSRLLVGSVELQRYFSDQWRGAIFTDAGDAFAPGAFDLRVGVGAGVHYLSPIGAIKLALASGVSEDSPGWRIHLTVGAEL